MSSKQTSQQLAVDAPRDRADISSMLSEDTPSPAGIKNKGANLDEDEDDQQQLQEEEQLEEESAEGRGGGFGGGFAAGCAR